MVVILPSKLSFEPHHDKTNKMTCAHSDDSSSPGALWDLILLHADSEDSDQTGRMPRLILVFAGRTCHFVGFALLRLKILML